MNCYSNEVKGRPNGLVRLIVVSGCGQVLSLSFRAGSNVRNGAHSGPFWSRADRSDGSAGKGFALKSPTNQLIAVALFPFCYCDVLLFFFFLLKLWNRFGERWSLRVATVAHFDSRSRSQQRKMPWINESRCEYIQNLLHHSSVGAQKNSTARLVALVAKLKIRLSTSCAPAAEKKKISKKWTLRLPPFMCTAYTISYAALLFCRCRTGGQSMPNLIT